MIFRSKSFNFNPSKHLFFQSYQGREIPNDFFESVIDYDRRFRKAYRKTGIQVTSGQWDDFRWRGGLPGDDRTFDRENFYELNFYYYSFVNCLIGLKMNNDCVHNAFFCDRDFTVRVQYEYFTIYIENSILIWQMGP